MTEDAVPERRVGQVVEPRARRTDAISAQAEPTDVVVAFQAQSKGRRTVQQAWIRAAVWVVASRAAFDSDRRVLVDKGTALVRMALRASNVVPEAMRNHPRRVRRAPRRERGSVWIVAIRAVHGPLVDTVLERHVEARLYLPMAAVADAPLLGR